MDIRLRRWKAAITTSLVALGVAVFAVPTMATSSFYLADDAVDVTDGVIEAAWGDALISDDEEDPDRTRYCWDVVDSEWAAITDPTDCTTYIYDEAGQIDLLSAWFGVNETNMLLAFETATAMFSVYDVAADEPVEIYNQQILQAGIDHLPNNESFSHDMVFSFDTEPVAGEETYDWYLVANIDYDMADFQGAVEEGASMLAIYQESGETAGFQSSEDEVVGELDPTLSEVSAEDGTASSVMEIRQNIEEFYTTTGITIGDEVGFRLETHSDTGDTTDAVVVTFEGAATEVTTDSIVVGSGATRFDGRKGKSYPKGVVTVYNDTADDQSEVLTFTAYNKKVGVQVAVGDVDGDGEQEIVTMPFKKTAAPEWKVFNLAGELEYSGAIPKAKGKGLHAVMINDSTDEEESVIEKRKKIQRLKQYYLAVGDVDGDGQDDIVLSGAKGNRLFIDVLTLNDAGKANRINQFIDEKRLGYAQGSWVEVADVDTGSDGDEIVTTPMRGKPVIDIWHISTDGKSLDSVAQYTDLERAGFTAGLHIAADDGMVVAAEHSRKGAVHFLEWVEAKGNLEPTNTTYDVGPVGNIAYNGTQVVYSSFTRKMVRKVNATGDTIYSIDTNHKGGFVEFLEVQE